MLAPTSQNLRGNFIYNCLIGHFSLRLFNLRQTYSVNTYGKHTLKDLEISECIASLIEHIIFILDLFSFPQSEIAAENVLIFA